MGFGWLNIIYYIDHHLSFLYLTQVASYVKSNLMFVAMINKKLSTQIQQLSRHEST